MQTSQLLPKDFLFYKKSFIHTSLTRYLFAASHSPEEQGVCAGGQTSKLLPKDFCFIKNPLFTLALQDTSFRHLKTWKNKEFAPMGKLRSFFPRIFAL